MNNDKDVEKILLNDENYENFIRKKTENDFKQILQESQSRKKSVITDIKNVPKDKLFCKNSTYFVINRNSKTTSYINGMQAEAYLASSCEKEKFLKRITDYFVSQNLYIKFRKYEG
ncbi:MAG TPA: hypothetical protein DEO94_04250 [Cyanobacteria bacterium UBA11991]|nr:hypothetical protein [Cyanobacteriota bacterium]MDY6358778.1 hypothetical protein [Cyanobacteriota bacterium]MDY6364423.1 hypothetical protein [Cyanobacteriota bacterium]MDY6383136.1 hypothetical protein [Cyanobacteriota bacterium]HCB11346.1 hypothetical protein [Cyanobacteria bacterium UBA11991]